MSKHIGRKQRWSQQDARTYTSELGKVVYTENAWYAELRYRVKSPEPGPDGLVHWIGHTRRLGPFRRPRNAMVELERELTVLRNRHDRDILIGDQVWGEG